MQSSEDDDEFSDKFSSPQMSGLQRADSNRSWNPLSQACSLI
jgi:hypothetical protein